MKTITFNITGMTCASCSSILQKAFEENKDIVSAQVNIATNKAQILFDDEKISEKEVKDIVYHNGYSIEENSKKNQEENLKKTQRRFFIKFTIALILTLPLVIRMFFWEWVIPGSFWIFPNTHWFMIFSSGIVVLGFGWQYHRNAFLNLLRKNTNMDTLISLGTLTAYFYSVYWGFLVMEEYFETASVIIIFMMLGKFLEEKTKGKTGDAIKKLMGLQPKTAILLKDNKEIVVSISELQKGDTIIVKPGEKIPVDGEIVFGVSTIDESSITGESIPVTKIVGDIIIGGTINKTSILHFTAKSVGDETMLAQIIKIMEEATSSKAPVQLLADKISYYFVPIVIVIAVTSSLIWYFLGFGIAFALTIFVSVLVIACPCSLGLATPTAVMMGTGLAAQRGILIKNAKALETAKKSDTFIFDKTGTITKGKPEVVDMQVFNFLEEKLFKIAYSLAKNSHHPLSLSVQEYANKKNVLPVELEYFEEKEGKGLKAYCKVHKKLLLLGNKKLLADENIILSDEVKRISTFFAENGKTPLFVAHENQIIGIIGIMDDVKEDSVEAIQKLKKMGKNVIMITGDHQKVAEAIANKVGIDEVIAEVYPAQKAEKIKFLQSQGKVVAMVGDGVNDAPALAQSDLGIALGSGTDIALEAGEIILIKNSLKDVVEAVNISTYTLRKIKQNLFWAFFYNSAGIPIAAGILYPFFGFLLSPIIAALAMSFSSVSVVCNSLLMKLYKAK